MRPQGHPDRSLDRGRPNLVLVTTAHAKGELVLTTNAVSHRQSRGGDDLGQRVGC